MLDLTEVIGAPGDGFQRPDDPELPYVLLTGDEMLHLIALVQTGPGKRPVHINGGNPYGAEPRCELCGPIMAKTQMLLDISEGKVPRVA